MRKKIIDISVLAYFIFLLFLVFFHKKANCIEQKEESSSQKIVRIAKGPIYNDDVYCIEKEYSLGGKHETREEYIYSNIKEIDIDESDNLYVLDIKKKRISVFDKEGTYVKTLGGIGQGPGEFQWPWSISISPQKKILIVDLMKRVVSIFSLEGRFEKEIHTKKYEACSRVFLTSKNEIIAEMPMDLGMAIKKYNSEFDEETPIVIKTKEIMSILDELSAKIVWDLSKQDKIVWGDSDKYEINIQEEVGQINLKIIKKYKKIGINEDEYKEDIKRKFGGRPIPPGFEKELPKYYPAFQSINVDDRGRIFVKTFEKADPEGYYCDVFDQDGRYLAKIPIKSQFQVWKNNRFYAVEVDKEGNYVVTKYKVYWKMQ